MPDRRSGAFQRALDEAGRKDRALHDGGADLVRGARIREVAFGPAPGSGGKARFGLALDWTDEPADRPAPPQPPPPLPRQPTARSGDASAEIATELGLGAPLTLAELTSRWRDFVWRNPIVSPRRPESAPTRAWRSPTRFTIGRGARSPSRDSRPPAWPELSASKRQ
jgi:hypothetical protein